MPFLDLHELDDHAVGSAPHLRDLDVVAHFHPVHDRCSQPAPEVDRRVHGGHVDRGRPDIGGDLALGHVFLWVDLPVQDPLTWVTLELAQVHEVAVGLTGAGLDDVDATRHIEWIVGCVVAEVHGVLVESGAIRGVHVLAKEAVPQIDGAVVVVDPRQLHGPAADG